MDRRRFVEVAGAATGTLALAGCIGFGPDDADVLLVNEGNHQHGVAVCVTGDFPPVAVSATLPPGERSRTQGVVPVLDYDHEAEFAVMVDGVLTRERREVESPDAFELRLVGDAMPEDVRLSAVGG